MPSSSKNKVRKSTIKREKNKKRQKTLRVELHNNFRQMMVMAFRGQSILKDAIDKFKDYQTARGIPPIQALYEELESSEEKVANIIIECDKVATSGRELTKIPGSTTQWENMYADEAMGMFTELERYSGEIAEIVENTLITLDNHAHEMANKSE